MVFRHRDSEDYIVFNDNPSKLLRKPKRGQALLISYLEKDELEWLVECIAQRDENDTWGRWLREILDDYDNNCAP